MPRRRQRGGLRLHQLPIGPVGWVQTPNPPQYGAGFFQDFAKGFVMPFKAVNSIIPGGLSTLAGAVHPGLGVGAKLLGLGRRRPRRGVLVQRGPRLQVLRV